MVLKSVGIFIALCAALTSAVDREFRIPADHEYYHRPHVHRARLEPASSEHVAHNAHHTLHKPHHSHNSESEGWNHHGSNHPHAQHHSELDEWNIRQRHSDQFGVWNSRGYPKPHVPYHTEGFGEWEYHGLPDSHYPHNFHESGESHYPSQNKPYYPHLSEESGAPFNQKPHFSPNSHEQYWENKVNHRPDWFNPHFPQLPAQLQQQNIIGMERRRPLFYPIYPYHFYHPHAQPSTNDEEFETIEAGKGRNIDESRSRRSFARDDSSLESSELEKHGLPHYHGHHNPNFPTNLDSSENDVEQPFGPYHHGFHHPHFYPFHKEPASPESSEELPTSDEAQPFSFPSLFDNEDSQESFIIFGNDEDKFKLPGIIQDIIDHFHHGHGKPHHHGDKPTEDQDEDDEEGSGEQEIIPLSSGSSAPLIEEDVSIPN